MRTLALLAACTLALAGCTSTTTNGITTTTVNPIASLAVGDAFTLAQASAKAAIAKNPTSATAQQIQADLTAAQQAFLAWSANPTAGTAEAQALSLANNALVNYLISKGMPV